MNQHGRIVTLFLAVLLPLIVAAAIALLFQSNKSKYTFNVQNALKIIRSNLYVHLDESVGWGYTVADTSNGNLSCLRTNTDCSAMAAQKNAIAVVRTIADDVYMDNLSSPTRGMTLDGRQCSTYSAVNSDPQCPVKITVTWKPVCLGAPCLNPPFLLEVKFTYTPPVGKVAIDTSKYDFSLSK